MMDNIKPPMRHIKWAEDAKGAKRASAGLSKKKFFNFTLIEPATDIVISLSAATFDNKWLLSEHIVVV